MNGGSSLCETEREFIQEILTKKLNAVTIFLFGSFARRTTHSESDVDIAFISPHRTHRYDVFLVAQELASKLNKEVDLIDLNQASTVMQIQIIQESECLYDERSDDTTLLKVKWMKEYARLNEERECILDEITESRTIYGV